VASDEQTIPKLEVRNRRLHLPPEFDGVRFAITVERGNVRVERPTLAIGDWRFLIETAWPRHLGLAIPTVAKQRVPQLRRLPPQQRLPPDSMSLSYSGDRNHASSSSAVAVTLTGVLAIGFTLGNSGDIAIAPGSTTGTSTIAVTPAGGFTGQVNLACAIPSTPGNSTGVLAPISCDIPLQVVISSASTVTLQGSSAAAEVPCRIKEAAAPLPVRIL